MCFYSNVVMLHWKGGAAFPAGQCAVSILDLASLCVCCTNLWAQWRFLISPRGLLSSLLCCVVPVLVEPIIILKKKPQNFLPLL